MCWFFDDPGRLHRAISLSTPSRDSPSIMRPEPPKSLNDGGRASDDWRANDEKKLIWTRLFFGLLSLFLGLSLSLDRVAVLCCECVVGAPGRWLRVGEECGGRKGERASKLKYFFRGGGGAVGRMPSPRQPWTVSVVVL